MMKSRMYNRKFVQYYKYTYLLSNQPDLIQMQWFPLFFDQIIEIPVQHLKHQTDLSHILKLLKELHHINAVWI